MANIILRLSTGSTTVVTSSGEANSLGGKMGTDDASKILVTNTSINNVFDDISKLENSNGNTDYRVVYIHNDVAALSGDVFVNGLVYLAGTTRADIRIAVGTKNVDAELLANESVAPVAASFTSPTEAAPLQISPDDLMNEGDFVPLYIERVANNIAGSGTITDSITLVVRGVE